MGEVRGGASSSMRRWREEMRWREISHNLGPLGSDLGPVRAAALNLGDIRSSNKGLISSQSSRDVDRRGICRII